MNQNAENAGSKPSTTVLETPKVDDWHYRILDLHNGLQALLISDPSADMAAAAMDVRFVLGSQ